MVLPLIALFSRLETPGVVLKDGQLRIQSGGAMEERESPRSGLTDHCYATKVA